ncbi:MAG: competence/damage-inducible protein A [Roseofilum sp. SID2]|uniref:competence/damage-inducible protein A n=1 Tax=unclassified Roseofilum TaxID=2620099 RepID=UPI001B010D22|nr:MULTISPECIES: competence/damage-inducible protein A [unclassified Roseofilum]MBP0012857.1 competence/damage-inducible protein A [Roseofilum sp. SID3]MBP0025517.1 competence/damage-inducible protein A [Roseofilum sp. SID2]MBP0037952.1 competence/damage-inducible protein A [Roseofilum sp. SID1]
MTAEIICVGTELLLGDILNRNAQFLAQELAKLGIPHYYQTVVGDNVERLKNAIATALDRQSEIILFTGGLGPTPDDLTCETIASFFETHLIERPEVIADIEAKYAQRGRTMNPSNRKQALTPEGAMILPNPSGTAPGIIWHPHPHLTLMTFPGVPSEMHRMWKETAVPYLKQQGWGDTMIYSRTLKFWGIGESALVEKIPEVFEYKNPTVAPYAGKGLVKLRISTCAASEPEAQELINPVERHIRAIVGEYCFGVDDQTLADVVGKLLLESGQTLAVAESCTGGGLGAAITAVPGSSAYFRGGVIAYDNQVKIGLLGVNPDDLGAYGAVSDRIAEQMATGIQQKLNTDWALSITGIAGPGGGTAEKPIGLVYIGLASPNGEVTHYRQQLASILDRSTLRDFSQSWALDRLRKHLHKS